MDFNLSVLLLGLTAPDLAIALGASAISFTILYRLFLNKTREKKNSLLLNSLLNEQDQIVVILDENEKIIFANKSFRNLLGLPDISITGQKLADLPSQEQIISAFTKNNEKLLKHKSASVTYNQKFRKNKDDFWYEFQKRTVYQEEQGQILTLILATDITDRKFVEQKLNLTKTEYRQLVETATDMIYRTDIAGNIIYINKAVLEILGYSQDEAIEYKITDLVFEDDKAVMAEYYRAKLNGLKSANYIEFRAISKSGNIKWLGQTTTAIFENDEIVGLQSVARDITTKMEAEEELKRAKEIAERTSEAKSNFISSLSHEFRTPLNAILGYSQILEKSHSTLGHEKSHVKEIKLAGEQLLEMVNDILELSNLDADVSGEQDQKIAIHNFMDTYARRFEHLAQKKGLEFNFSPDSSGPKELLADFQRFSIVVKNLLDNAVKFTEKGSVDFSYKINKNEQGRHYLKIRVCDTGTGISENELELIYQPFWQKEPLKNKGTGLGLTLSKRLTEFLGGEISISNSKTGGVIVDVSVPVSVPMSNEQRIKVRKGNIETEIHIHRNDKIRVLIVDDLEPNRTITRIILKENDFDYKEAEDGLEALSMIESYKPDIILMDINMPVMDGIEAMLKIRSNDWRFKNIPIVAVTAGAKGGKKELMERGFSDYIQKPFREIELLDSIKNLLNVDMELLIDRSESSVLDPNDITPEKVGNYILNMDKAHRKYLESILEEQNYDELCTNSFQKVFDSYSESPEMIRLIDAATEYDFSFASKVLNAVKKED